MKPATAPSALKVQAALGDKHQVLEFDATTRTAADAAAAIGCTVAQIAKSLIFRGAGSNRPVLVVASGVNRVDEAKVAETVGEQIARADADSLCVRRLGPAIGGVPPAGQQGAANRMLIDESLMSSGGNSGRRGNTQRGLSPVPIGLPGVDGRADRRYRVRKVEDVPAMPAERQSRRG